MKDKLSIKGKVSVFDFDGSTENEVKSRMAKGEKVRDIVDDIGCKGSITFDNMVLEEGIIRLANNFLSTTNHLPPLKSIQIGTGTTATTIKDTKLENKVLDLDFTNCYMDKVSGIKIVAELFLATGEANFEWKELGLATSSTKESESVLFSRVVTSITKTNQVAKTLVWEITLG